MSVFRFILIAILASSPLLASEAETGASGQQLSEGLLELVFLIVVAKLGAELFERLKQPSVLGELTVGMVLSGFGLAGIEFVQRIKTSEGMQVAAEIGVILLLFEVGLESHMGELLEVGFSALLVAVMGVIAPMVLGYGVSAYFLAGEAWYIHLFVGGTLAATSVGITARVLQDLKKVDTKEARIILGAAVVDDVLGLIVLAVVSGIVTSVSSGAGDSPDTGMVLVIILKSVAFLVAAIVVGRFLHINAVRAGTKFRVPGVPLVIATSFCFVMAALAGLVGLAPIVGAFAAGLVLEPSDYEVYQKRGELPIEKMIRPLVTILTPLFFVMMGLQVDLRAFTSGPVLAFAGVLSLAAIIGKQVCSLGVLEKGVKRLVVGIGMIPRGEVGLIFTGIGAKLAVHGQAVFSPSTVSAMVVMVMVTTLVTPPVLKVMFAGDETDS